MFAAAAASAAFVCDDPLEAVLVGVGEVPDTSRLAGAVGRCVRLHLAGESWEQAVRELESAWGHLPPGHAVRTAGRVALALLYGKMALAATVELAAAGAGERIPVAPGVAGAILGPMLGEPGAPEWPVRPGDTVAGGAGGRSPSPIWPGGPHGWDGTAGEPGRPGPVPAASKSQEDGQVGCGRGDVIGLCRRRGKIGLGDAPREHQETAHPGGLGRGDVGAERVAHHEAPLGGDSHALRGHEQQVGFGLGDHDVGLPWPAIAWIAAATTPEPGMSPSSTG